MGSAIPQNIDLAFTRPRRKIEPMPEDSHLAERARKAAKIIAKPTEFKVCEGCDSIVAVRVTTCPNCHGYRFDENPDTVAIQARLLGSRAQTSVIEDDLF